MIVKYTNTECLLNLFNALEVDRQAFKKRAIKLKKKAHPRFAASVLDRIIKASSPKAEYLWWLEELHVMNDAVKAVDEQGAHGFAVVNDTVHPIFITHYEDEDLAEIRTHEPDFSFACAHQALNTLMLKEAHVTIVLLSKYGFSGDKRSWPLERVYHRGPNVVHLKGTNLYYQGETDDV